MKTKEELNELKEEVDNLSKQLSELSEEELAVVSGGSDEYGLIRQNVKHIVKPLKDAEKKLASDLMIKD